MTKRKPYPTDLSDSEWQKIRRYVVQDKCNGRRRSVSEREILNGILYVEHVRCPWRMLPHDLPPWGTVYYYYSLWRENGILMQIRLQLGR